jgi:hypothetical protein
MLGYCNRGGVPFPSRALFFSPNEDARGQASCFPATTNFNSIEEYISIIVSEEARRQASILSLDLTKSDHLEILLGPVFAMPYDKQDTQPIANGDNNHGCQA